MIAYISTAGRSGTYPLSIRRHALQKRDSGRFHPQFVFFRPHCKIVFSENMKNEVAWGFRDAPEIYGFDFIERATPSALTLFWLSAFLWLLRFSARARRLSKYVK